MLQPSTEVAQLKSEPSQLKEAKVEIDWTDPKAQVSKHFTVHEAIYLPTWGRLATETDGLTDEVKANLITLFAKMDIVREYFGKPINVHVTYRPEEYNKLIGGAPMSAHKFGKACDFDVSGMNCDDVRSQIMANHLLETWDFRMEMLPGSVWVHLGNDWKSGIRYFKP